MTSNDAKENANDRAKEDATKTPVVQATEVGTRGVAGKVRTFLLWAKVVVVVVLLVLLVIAVLQNLEEKAKIMLILNRWSPDSIPVAVIIGVSFVSGVVITLLLMFLRRSSGK